jgi:hypothetical protein
MFAVSVIHVALVLEACLAAIVKFRPPRDGDVHAGHEGGLGRQEQAQLPSLLYRAHAPKQLQTQTHCTSCYNRAIEYLGDLWW